MDSELASLEMFPEHDGDWRLVPWLPVMMVMTCSLEYTNVINIICVLAVYDTVTLMVAGTKLIQRHRN